MGPLENATRHGHPCGCATVNSAFALVDLVIEDSLIPFSRPFLRLGGTLSLGRRSVPPAGFGAVDSLSCVFPLGNIWAQFTDGQRIAHCSVGRSDVKLSVLRGRTPATLSPSESEICAAT